MNCSISVIVPTLNEASQIESAIATIQQGYPLSQALEIIVADGGSCDRTVELVQDLGIQVVHAPRGRASQMNAGADAAQGDILLFLHADTRLPPTYTAWIQTILSQPKTVAGAFELEIDGNDPRLRWVERGVRWRSRYGGLPYGDQALFMTARVFHQVGGFPPLPILEDVEMVKRLKRLGRIQIAPAAVRTSARRWQTLGVVRTTLINQLVLLAFRVGVSPEKIAAWYRSAPQRWQ